jgi:hypothetical protein
MIVCAYQITNLNSAVTTSARRSSWNSLRATLCLLRALLDASNRGSDSSSLARSRNTTTLAASASNARALVHGQDLIE